MEKDIRYCINQTKAWVTAFLGFTSLIPLNVSLKYSWFGLIMLCSNFHLTFSNSHGKVGSLEKTVCPSLVKPGA